MYMDHVSELRIIFLLPACTLKVGNIEVRY